MARVERSHVGFRGPSSVPLGKHHDPPSQHINQLQFNLHAPYTINSLASNFQKPQPLVIERFPLSPPSGPTTNPVVRRDPPIPSSPASSVSSERMHLAMQFAKIDAKKLWKEQKELKESEDVEEEKEKINGDNSRKMKASQGKGVKKTTQDTRRPNVGYMKRNLRDSQFFPNSDENGGSEEKQALEVRRLEKQIQNYLQRLDDLIHKGHEVIQKKDKRLHVRRSDKDDRSHLSDEDTDPRQYERAEEQATRSARVLYMIERQIQELDDEIRKKGRNMKQSKKTQTLGRLAAAQRATVRALRMFINSAPLQPKDSQHYPSIYQALTSLIQQLSLLAIQVEGGDEEARTQNATRFDSPLKKYSEQRAGVSRARRLELPRTETKSNSNQAFSQEPAEIERKRPSNTFRVRYQPLVKEPFPDDSTMTVDATPERSATLRAGLEALLRAKELEKKRSRPPLTPAGNTKKKSVLLPRDLQAKRKKSHAAVQRTVKFPSDSAHFTKDTTASRLKKVERQKTTAKGETKFSKKVDNGADGSAGLAIASEPAETRSGPGVDHQLHEREIQRQLWLEDETKKKLRDVMDIPKSLVSEAEEAIKMRLKPILDQAQAVVESSKSKPVHERFANIASKTTMQKNEVLSEMLLDDLLLDTAREFQRLERSDEVESEASYLQNSSTLENILQRLEYFEKEEESIRRHLTRVSYIDTNETKRRRDVRQGVDEGRENMFTKEKDKETRTVKPSTDFEPGGKPPMPFILPPNLRDSIFSYREKYSEYLKQTNADGKFDPWQFVERLSDDILEEIINDVANEFSGACDDVTEIIFKSEFMKE